MEFVIDHVEHRARYQRLQVEIARSELDALLVFAPEDIYYLTGFETLGYYFVQCLVVPSDGEPTLIVRHFETPNVEQLTWLTSYRGYRDHEDVAFAIAETARACGTRVGAESEGWFASPALFARIGERLGQSLINASGIVGALRVVKSDAEIELIRRAARYTEAAMAAAFEASKPGVTEDDIAAATYARMISSGSSYTSLAPFIATGPRSALPHATWSGRRLEPGDVLFYETGGSAGRYGAALIRVGVVGEPAPSVRPTLRRAVGVIVEALEALVDAIEPGVSGQDIHRRSRDLIEDAGWGDVHRNRSGYSIGISFPPDWGEGQIFSLREGELRPVEPGMVFHLVPNVLIPDVAGVGLSETVLVTEGGCEVLTKFPRELIMA